MQGQLPPEAREKVEELQELQSKAQQVAVSKQQAEAQLNDAKTAVEALEDVEADATMYREVGELLVETDRDSAEEDLEDRIDSLEIRVQTLEKQEGRFQEQFEELQSELEELLQGANLGGGLGGGGGPAPGGPGGPGAGG